MTMNFEIQYEITQFLYQEAYLLDHKKYKEWLELLDESIVYRMPVRVTVERREGSDLAKDMSYFEETKQSLTTRVERLYTSSAWVEDPPPRQRHFISNIMIQPGSEADEYHVRSYFDFERSRGSDPEIEKMIGEREDVLRRVNGEWKIAARTIFPDQAVLGVMNLSMFL
jgi:3-phenylpropionate/cinnamic acid dioxygenase small subunit